jgi:hypothetical protein
MLSKVLQRIISEGVCPNENRKDTIAVKHKARALIKISFDRKKTGE